MKIQLSVHLLTTERHPGFLQKSICTEDWRDGHFLSRSLSRGFGLKEAILEAPCITEPVGSGDAEESKHPVFGKCVDKASFDVMATW